MTHVAEVLCHRSRCRRDARASTRATCEAALGRRDERATVHGGSGAGHVPRACDPATPWTRVSIVIPFRDEPRFLRTCVDSVTATTRA